MMSKLAIHSIDIDRTDSVEFPNNTVWVADCETSLREVQRRLFKNDRDIGETLHLIACSKDFIENYDPVKDSEHTIEQIKKAIVFENFDETLIKTKITELFHSYSADLEPKAALERLAACFEVVD